MNVGVVTDSAAGLPIELVERYHIAVVPIYVGFGDQLLRDGVDLTPARFYEQLEQSDRTPTTAAPSAGDFLSAYQKLAEAGATGIVGVILGSGLSGTFDSAWQAAQLLEGPPVQLIDSGSVSMATGFMALAAARKAAQGADLNTVAQAAEQVRDCLSMRFTLDTLEYLRRGGRIGA